MSINITVHGNTLETVTRRNKLCDPERAKKELIAERRKQRIEQVRQQSKELASQVRRNVDQEIKKQERRIEETKQNELLQWREKAMSEAHDHHKKSLSAVGGAHRAALDERECNEKVKARQKSNELMARQRGESALRTEQQKILAQKKPLREKSKRFVPKKVAQKNDENSSKLANTVASQEVLQVSEDEDSSSGSEEDEPPHKENQPKSSLKKTKVVCMEVNSDSDSSSISLQDSHEESNMHFYRVSNKSETSNQTTEPSKRSSYNAIEYKASDTSSDQPHPSEQPPPRPRQFTQISEMIRKRQSQSVSNISTDPRTLTESCVPISKSPPKTQQSSLKSRLPLETITTKSGTQSVTRSSRKFTSSGTTKSNTKSESSHSVQFYDYNNKFAKQYEQGQGVVKPNAKSRSEMNAMDSARLELLLQEKQRKSAEELRQKAEERCQKAIEREQIRRDCELLTKQLDSLNKDKGIMGQIHGRGVTVFSQNKMQQIESNRQKKMNTAVEKILTQPVLITCPEVNPLSCSTNSEKIPESNCSLNVANYLDNKNCDYVDGLNGSDSCASILLGYVDNQSKQISQDIGKCENAETVDRLSCLLSKINDVRSQLLEELKKCKELPKDKVDIENIAHSVSDLRKQREHILSDDAKNINSIKADLEKRERRLKRKEVQIAKKYKELAECKAEKKESAVAVSNVEKASKPVQIIIKLNDGCVRKSTKSPHKSPRKRSSLIDIKHTKRKKIVLVRRNESTPEKETKLKLIEREERVQAPSTSSTSYLSPPDVVHTKLGDLLANIQKEKLEPNKKLSEPEVDLPQKMKKNPLLTHYIQRLLGMSRNSIDMLGVSSSEIETPTSSMINNPTNISTTESDIAQKERMQRLQEFLNENYSFLSELEDSIKSGKSLSSSTESSNKTIEKVWLQALKKKTAEQSIRDSENDIKSILKKKTAKAAIVTTKSPDNVSKSQSDKMEIVEPQPVRSQSPPRAIVKDRTELDSEKLQLVGKYTKLTENCTKRIAELTEMINKVRKEKQKILEITLTSGSETGRNSTEYMDFADNRSNKSTEDNSSKIVDAKNSLRSEEESEKVHLEKNKLTGISRDSGISLSRPVTALDTHDAVDMRIFGRFTPEQQYEPILKDIPKVAPQISPKTPAVSVTLDDLNFNNKRLRPPSSMARYSPQLVEEVPHELSTIFEVDTPATSRLNASITERNVSHAIEVTNREKVSYKSFPTYEEYAESHNLNLSQSDHESSSKLHIDIREVVNISDKGKLEYEEFPTLNTYLHQDSDNKHDNTLIESQTDSGLSYKRFPTHKSYAETHGITGLLDTQSIEGISISDKSSKPETVESGESLPDVVAELKKRNILKHSFRNDDQPEAKNRSPVSSPQRNKSPPQNSLKINTQVKKKIQLITTSHQSNDSPSEQGNKIDVTGIELLPTSSTTPDDIEKDLDKMGLKWASLMLKKSQQSMELSSTSSSFTYAPRRKSPKKVQDKAKTASTLEQISVQEPDDSKFELVGDTSSGGSKPLNLREFLAKELLKRTNTSNSLSSSDDSLASHFLRSLIGSANSSPHLSHTKKTTQDRHRTSTPILIQSSSSSKPSHESSKLFSGESCISSVRLSSATNRESSSAGQSNTSDDILTIPNFKLDLDKCRSSKHK